MRRGTPLLAAMFCLLAIAPCRLLAQNADGLWKLTYLSKGGTTEIARLVVELKAADGKLTGKVFEGRGERHFGDDRISIKQEGSMLRIQGPPNGEFTMDFQAPIVNPPPKRWLGGYSFGKTMHAAWLTPISAAEAGRIAESHEERTHVCPPLQEAAAIIRDLDKQIGKPRFGFGGATVAQRRAYEKRIADAEELGNKETAPHYRKVLAKFPNDPGVFVAVLGLLRGAKANKATLDDVKSWSAAADKLAKEYGPYFEAKFSANALEALDGQDAYAVIAVELARRVERALPPKATPQQQIDVSKPLARALRGAGKVDDAKTVETQIEQLESQLDREYLASLPEVKPFTGRKGKSDRVVLLEQFEPISINSRYKERASSLLLRAYKPSELAIVHYPIYGSGGFKKGFREEPTTTSGILSSPDGNARWGYLRKAFPLEAGSAAGIFNGLPKGRFQGGKTEELAIFKDLSADIDPLLEEDAGAILSARAVRSGDKIDIEVNATLKQADQDKKLRVVLVEREVRYPITSGYGSTGARVHHNIARACPGGVAGKPLTEAVSRHTYSVDVADLRKQLAKHLEDAFDENGRLLSVPPPASLLKLDSLRVIAFVQDDNTREVLQAVQVDVK